MGYLAGAAIAALAIVIGVTALCLHFGIDPRVSLPA